MTDDRIIDIFQQHGQYVTPRDYALIRSIAEAVAPQRTWVVPDFLTAHDPETLEYKNGWNDCRQLMMEMLRKEIK